MQKSIDKAMTSLVRYSEDYQEVLDIVYKGNRSYTAIEINEVDNGKILPAPLPMIEDMESKWKKLREPNSSIAKMGKSAQDQKKDSRPLNNIQATAQTENRDQDKLVSSLAGSMSSVKLPLVCATGQFDCDEYDNSGHFSDKSLHKAACISPMLVKDLWYKEYPSSLMTPDLPNIPTIGFSELDTSKCMIFSPEYNETFMGTDYCKDNTNFKQLSADNETCRLQHFVNDKDVSTDICLKKCLVEVPSDSEGTSFEEGVCAKSITSSCPIQSRSLSDRKTYLYTSSLSSNAPSEQTGEMKESPVKKCDPIFENIVEESHSETENLSENEKKQPLQIFSLYQQHIDGDMKSRDITENEGLESKQQETDEGNVDFSDYESKCVTDSEDDSQITLQSGKVDAYSRNIKESHRSQSTTNNAGYICVDENHSLITLEEFYNAHYVKENSDRQISVETANFQKEKESTYPACLKGNIYVGNMKENYSLENMKGFTNYQLSADYMNAVFDPFYFRPELPNAIVYPGLQRYSESLQEDPPSHEESLRYEWLRLQSLRNYHGAGSIIRLAQGGFYHDPVDGQLSTRCYACNALYTNWEFFDNVTEVHRRLSPNCPHLRENASESGNVSVDNEQMNNQPNRTESSVTVETPEERANESDSQSATTVNSITDSLEGTQIRDKVAEGFPQQPTEGRLITDYDRSFPNHSATGPEFNLNTGPRTETNSAHQSGNAENGRDVNDTATSVNSASPAQTSQQTETVIQGLNNPNLVHVTSPKYREYATIDSRTTSFTSIWPSYLDQTPQQMADAGFFYTGVADITRCFVCGGGLRDWEAGPSANFNQTLSLYPFNTQPRVLRTLRKRHFGNIVGKLAEQRRNAEQQAQGRQEAKNVSQDPMAKTAAQALLEMGYSRGRTKEAILAVRRNTGHNFVSAEQALQWILDRDEQEEKQSQDIESLRAENEKLKERLTCKICLGNLFHVLFLSCGHLVCCVSCAERLRKCPICRCRIDSSIRIFMS